MLNVRLFTSMALVTLFVFVPTADADSVQLKKERTDLLAIYQSVSARPLKVINLKNAPRAHRTAVKYYQHHLWPLLQQMEVLAAKADTLDLGLKRGLYKSTEERLDWESKVDNLRSQHYGLVTDPKFRGSVATLSNLTEGLRGEFPNGLAKLISEIGENTFSKAMNSSLAEDSKLSQQIRHHANNSNFNDNLTTSSADIAKIKQQFADGALSFEDAVSQLRDAERMGSVMFTDDLVAHNRQRFDQIAMHRTQLAEEKGFNNWAEYSVSNQASSYAEGFADVKGRISFLQNVLALTENEYGRLLNERMEEFGLPKNSTIDWAQFQILHPTPEASIAPYFPKEKLVETVKKSLMNSGFSQGILDDISYDSEPRQGKTTHALQTSLQTQFSDALTIDARTLDASFTEQPNNKGRVKTFVLQNLRADGIAPLTTVFHETGHALDFLHSSPTFSNSRTASYNETMALTLESFATDSDFLKFYGRSREGREIPQQAIDNYIKGLRLRSFMRLRYQVGLALFDLLIWNQPYKQDGPQFTRQAERLYIETIQKATLTKANDNYDRSRVSFLTDHFYSGTVDYIGYIEAEIAREITSNHILDKLEAVTGRRSFTNQPELASILIEDYYRVGHRYPFPTSIEIITGSKFSAETFSTNLLKGLQKKELKRPTSSVRCQSIF